MNPKYFISLSFNLKNKSNGRNVTNTEILLLQDIFQKASILFKKLILLLIQVQVAIKARNNCTAFRKENRLKIASLKIAGLSEVSKKNSISKSK